MSPESHSFLSLFAFLCLIRYVRFVVLHHTGWPGKADHYDLLLQLAEGGSDDDPVLKAFATATDEFPSGAGPPAANPLRLLPDHRRLYLKFEGPLAHNRGRVQRVDEGELALLRPLQPGLPETCMRLSGRKLNGTFLLRCEGDEAYTMERTPCLSPNEAWPV